MSDRPSAQSSYVETLAPPARYFAAAWVFALALGVSFFAALGPVAGLAALAVPGALATGLLARAGTEVRVQGGELVAGAAHIPVDALGPVEVLDADGARQVRGPESDPAGFHLIRAWLPTGVRAQVVDPGDPTPYWFVASADPAALAGAIEAARQPGRT